MGEQENTIHQTFIVKDISHDYLIAVHPRRIDSNVWLSQYAILGAVAYVQDKVVCIQFCYPVMYSNCGRLVHAEDFLISFL